ncbi:MAG: hypothetical protein IKV16_05665 [Clostridia bacterium]|nr:hypothetical protein [Clostridia bacterium]
MNSGELTSIITAIANAISLNLSLDELTVAASVFVQIGDTLATIATHRAILEEKEKS